MYAKHRKGVSVTLTYAIGRTDILLAPIFTCSHERTRGERDEGASRYDIRIGVGGHGKSDVVREVA